VDWSGEAGRKWPGRHSQVYTPFRAGLIRAERLNDDRGRGLVSGNAVSSRKPICSAQPPLSLLQYSDSRSLCEVCAHCHRFCGNLGSALRRSLETAGAESPEELIDPELLKELEVGEWELRQRVPCEHGCGAVFCSHECAEAGKLEGWHRTLCVDLSPEQRKVWKFFKLHAARHHEQFVAAAQVMAEIICLVKYHGVELWEAMAYFTRFAKMSWLNMLNLPSRSYTQAPPREGKLAVLAQVRREKRMQVMMASLELLVACLWEKDFHELLTLDYYSNLVGQFSLSNVWVQIEHPLSEKLRAKCEDPEFRQRYEPLLKASRAAANKVIAEANGDKTKSKDKEDDDDEDDRLGKKVTFEEEPQEEPAAEGSKEDDIWTLPRFEGSALYPCVALSNHSCRPNFTMRYADGCFADMMCLRDVAPGEELNLAYVSPSTDLSERLASLWRHWGFVCTCRKCQDEIMERAVKEADTSSGSTKGGYPSDLPSGVKLSPAGVAAALAARAKGAPEEELASDEYDEESEEEEGSSEESESGSEDEQAFFEGGAGFARHHPFGGPLGPLSVPDSVKNLEADLKNIMDLMQEAEDESSSK